MFAQILNYFLLFGMAGLFGYICLRILRKPVKTGANKIVLILAVLALIHLLITLLGMVFKTTILFDFLIAEAWVALPTFWVLMSAGVIYYGISGIIKREIFINTPAGRSLSKTTGFTAIIMGIAFVFIGLLMLLVLLTPAAVIGCSLNKNICPTADFLNTIFKSVGGVLTFAPV
jgi:hypothetical protein